MTATRRRRRRIGSAGRLAALHAGVLAAVLGLVVVALVQSFSSSYEQAEAATIGAQLFAYQHAAIERGTHEGLRAFSVHFLETHPLAAGETVDISLLGSGLVETAGANQLNDNRAVKAWLESPPEATMQLATTVGGRTVELVATPLRVNGSTIGTFVAAGNLEPFVVERTRVLDLSLAEAGIALLVGVTSSFFLLRRLLRKVGRITATAEEIGNGEHDQRIGHQDSADEVGELAQTFDAMLDRLKGAMDAQRRLLSDVSHQLRTPLTVARGHLEILGRTDVGDPAAVRETLAIAIDELDHMARLVERLLMLGRAMEPELFDRERIELPAFLGAIHDAVAALVPRCRLRAPLPDIAVFGDPEQLRGAIFNLLDNAVKATGDSDTIEIGAEFGRTPSDIRLVVEDSGHGIPASQRDAALERFGRPGARDGDGSGLGLAIARAVVTAHGGTIEIDQSPALGGARVAIALPVLSMAGTR